MRAIIATGVVFLAAHGVATPSWADLVLAESQQHAALAATGADPATGYRPMGHHALMLSTRAEVGALTNVRVPPAAPLPVATPVGLNTATHLEPRSDDQDRSNMGLMVLVALAMLMTVVFKGNQA